MKKKINNISIMYTHTHPTTTPHHHRPQGGWGRERKKESTTSKGGKTMTIPQQGLARLHHIHYISIYIYINIIYIYIHISSDYHHIPMIFPSKVWCSSNPINVQPVQAYPRHHGLSRDLTDDLKRGAYPRV